MGRPRDTEWDLKTTKPGASADSIRDRQRERPIGFSTYMPRSLAKRLRHHSIESERPVWELVTEAVEQWLDRND